LDTDYPPLLSYKPDILVVESFAYNQWSGNLYDLDRQWLTIDRIIKTVKEKLPETKIILAASIAPNSKTFGDGKLNWPQDLKYNSAQITKAYLQNLTNFATSQGFPLADAYHTSLGPDGNGQAIFINQGDHLHPSNEGARLFYEKIMEAIKQNNIIK
jgi:lysophospholipase L1-like esterase